MATFVFMARHSKGGITWADVVGRPMSAKEFRMAATELNSLLQEEGKAMERAVENEKARAGSSSLGGQGRLPVFR
jgi:hypothetical protein